jgi:hypothetical protein
MRIVLANFVQPQHRRLCTLVAQASTDYSRSRKKSYVREFLGSASSLPHCIAFAEVKGGSHCCLPPEGSGEGAAPCFLVTVIQRRALLRGAIRLGLQAQARSIRMVFPRTNWPMRKIARKANAQLDLILDQIHAVVALTSLHNERCH